MEEKQPGLALSEFTVAFFPIEKEECYSYFIFLRLNSLTLPLLPELSYTWFSPYKTRQKKANCGASLVAQWLRICLPMQGTRVQALVWEDPACRGAAGPVSHNY